MHHRLVAAIVASGAIALIAGAPAMATPTWAPAATAPIHPGVQTFTNGAQCTANFVFYDAANVYIGQAAHCSGTGGSTATNGCTSPMLPVGTLVQVTGAGKPGVMVYNSWSTMQASRESDANTCQFNDLALVRLDPSDAANVNPSIPFWGGPSGINTAGVPAGSKVLSFGNSELRDGIAQLSPKEGASLDGTPVTSDSGGWSHTVATVSPGIPGDSGSPFLDADGNALGVLSTLDILPLPLSNGVGDIGHELGYLASHTPFAVTLAQGTTAFRGPLV